MPLTDIGSYVPTAQEFEAHWTDVDADRVANTLPALTLPPNIGLADFTAEIAAVAAAVTELEDLENAREIATATRDSLRETMRDRIIEFRAAVDYRLKGSPYVRALPDTPQPRSSEQRHLKALDDVDSLWTRIDADTGVPNFVPPLTLRGGYTLATFQADLATLRNTFKSITEAENDLRLARAQRDELLEQLRVRMVSYREAIEVEYGPEHVFTETLPDVFPSSGGSNGGSGGSLTAPTGLALLAESDLTVTADWNDVVGADSYRAFVEIVPLGSSPSDTFIEEPTAFPSSDATLGPYDYEDTVRVKVRATNTEGDSPDSAVAEITLPSAPPPS